MRATLIIILSLVSAVWYYYSTNKRIDVVEQDITILINEGYERAIYDEIIIDYNAKVLNYNNGIKKQALR